MNEGVLRCLLMAGAGIAVMAVAVRCADLAELKEQRQKQRRRRERAKEIKAAGERVKRDMLIESFCAELREGRKKSLPLRKATGYFSDSKAQTLITGIFNNREEKMHNEKI